MGLSAQQLSQPLRLGHLRGDPRRLLRCLERPHGQIRGHHLNWNERMGTGQNLGRLVSIVGSYWPCSSMSLAHVIRPSGVMTPGLPLTSWGASGSVAQKPDGAPVAAPIMALGYFVH